MREYDLVVRGGTIVDGTGVPRYQADLAIKDGRVSMISGRIPPGAAKEIDASGCIVAPGAIDLHTHYDAQLNWDPYATLSGWFGVTSLTIGQCGFGFAPTRPEDRELNMRMMNRIEAIPLESMRLGMRWDWETFPEYLDSLDRQELGVNVGALFPFSPLRGYVLGMIPSRERTSVTEEELNEMKQLFHEAMEAGAFGFSSDMNTGDRPEDGSWLPSHVASNEEYLGLAEVLSQFGVGHIGWTIANSGGLPPEKSPSRQRELMAQMMRISGRPLHVLLEQESARDAWVAEMRAEGLPLLTQELVMEVNAEFKLAEYNLFDTMPNWVQPLVGSIEERVIKLRDPDVRAAMKKDVEEYALLRTDWSRITVLETVHERNYKYDGKTIEEIARMENKHPLDAFLDLALDEALETQFAHPVDPEPLEQNITNPYGHISVSDGGAHTRYLTTSTWPVEFLAHWVRDREVMSLEQAHYKMSTLPAWFTDFKDRGSLRVGAWADIMIYNQGELGFLYDKMVYANDFPGGERRVIQKPTGLRYTLVNGAVTFEGNECTGALPGKLLRSYDMVG
ncbi:MAG: amidohydrolase family protein [Chloroflexi bacterium]|nr:amidohydrolase family protein [Chloroflexota bacterium]